MKLLASQQIEGNYSPCHCEEAFCAGCEARSKAISARRIRGLLRKKRSQWHGGWV